MSRTYEQLAPVISALDERIETNLGAFPTDTAEGSIASFPDGADVIPLRSLVVDINPVQDLHGQDAPYPAGGGTNQWDEEWELGYYNVNTGAPTLSTTQIRSKNRIAVKPNTAYYIKTPIAVWVLEYDESDTYLNVYTSKANSVITTNANTHYIRFYTTNAYGTTYSHDIGINYPSTATDYAPYSNICPISGWTGCEVQHDGKNLLTYVPNKITAPLSVTLDKSRATLVKKGITYTMSFDMQNATTWRICAILFDLEGNRHFVNDEYPFGIVNPYLMPNASGQYYVWGGNYTNKSFVITPIDDFYAMFFFLLGDTTESTVMLNPMLEIGSTATPYEPYNGQTIPINWQTEAGTVYGGHLDVLSGVLTVDDSTDVYDGDETVTHILTANGCCVYALPTIGALSVTNADTEVRVKTDKLTPNSASRVVNQTVVAYQCALVSRDRIAVSVPDTIADVTAFTAWLAQNNLQVIYPLATPITIQLTPHEVKSLLGANNIFADTGDSEVEYRADTKLYIERLTEPDADMIADANITSGSYFMVGNTLYKATANIASGSAVIVGTNCTQKSLSEALNEINS